MSMIELSDAERRLADRIDPAAGGALAISPNAGGIAFTNASQAMDFAKMMALSNSGVRKHLRGNPGACLAIVVQAIEWGVSPYAVANKSYFVNDQIAFESQLVQAVILLRAPIRGRIKFEYSGSGQGRRCRAWARLREDDEIVEYESPELKDIGVKNSPLWKADPDQQFSYYAGRALCRRHFPDVLLGIYTDDDFAMPTPARPDSARDVTPARGLAGKLDAIAAVPEETKADSQPAKVDHDLETGEVDTDPSPEDERDAPTAAMAQPQDDPHRDLMDNLRDAVNEGQRVVALLNNLSPEQREMVTDEDKTKLTALQKKVEAAAKGQGAGGDHG